MNRPNLKSVGLPVPEIKAIGVLGGVGEEEAVGGRGWYTARKSISEFL